MVEKRNLDLNYGDDVMQGVYSNLAVIAHSRTEFVLDFVSNLPGMDKPEVRARILMSPEHAKRLLFALEDNIRKYENTFGAINVSNGPRTANPFQIEKGEA